jgi:hypothetical protein
MALHLIKLAVGAASVDDVRNWQAARAKAAPPLRHRTRNFPRRAPEILDGGSIYWVVARMVSVRQRIEDIVEAQQPDGTRCTDLVLHPVLVPVRARLMKPFQGWRYLADADAPEDENCPVGVSAGAKDNLSPALRRELAALALI